MIAALEELSIERKKNKRLSKNLNEYGDQLEDLCIQPHKAEHKGSRWYAKITNKFKDHVWPWIWCIATIILQSCIKEEF